MKSSPSQSSSSRNMHEVGRRERQGMVPGRAHADADRVPDEGDVIVGWAVRLAAGVVDHDHVVDLVRLGADRRQRPVRQPCSVMGRQYDRHRGHVQPPPAIVVSGSGPYCTAVSPPSVGRGERPIRSASYVGWGDGGRTIHGSARDEDAGGGRRPRAPSRSRGRGAHLPPGRWRVGHRGRSAGPGVRRADGLVGRLGSGGVARRRGRPAAGRRRYGRGPGRRGARRRARAPPRRRARSS